MIPLGATDTSRGYARWLARAGAGTVTAPARWRTGQWVLFLAIASATLLAYVEKRPLQACVQRGAGGVERTLALFADACGSGFAVTSLGLVALIAGRWARQRALVDGAVALAVAGFWCLIFTTIGQVVLAEARPNEGGAMKLFALGGHGVSGHAAAAAVLFSPIRNAAAGRGTARVRQIVTVMLLAWTALVAWSRVWLGMHFVWNVMLGLAIGFFTGFEAMRAQRSSLSGGP